MINRQDPGESVSGRYSKDLGTIIQVLAELNILDQPNNLPLVRAGSDKIALGPDPGQFSGSTATTSESPKSLHLSFLRMTWSNALNEEFYLINICRNSSGLILTPDVLKSQICAHNFCVYFIHCAH